MRKIVSIILALAFAFSIMPSALAVKHGKAVRISDFAADSSELTIDEQHELTFTAHIVTDNGESADARVCDDDGNVIATLTDNGKNGDACAHDGIYTATYVPDIHENMTVSYHAEADGLTSETVDVIYYHMLTMPELVAHEKFWRDAEIYRNTLRNEGASADQVLSCMYDYVKASDVVDVDTLEWANEYSFTFLFVFGTAGCIDEPSLAKGDISFDNGYEDAAEPSRSVQRGEASWENPDVMVFRPYRQSPNQGSFENEFYTGKAADICTLTGGKYTDFQERDAYPGNLKDICNYGFFIIDSHGTKVQGKSYMMMRKGDTSQYDYAADLSAGHILASGSDVGVTGSFFTKYIKDEGKTMPGTFLYLVVCLGMATDTICEPAIECGAQLVFGYTESVSFAWDFRFSATLFEYLTQDNPDHTERTYTFSEALEKAIEKNGDVDPYSVSPTDRGLARPRFMGNEDFVLKYDSFKPIMGVTIQNKDISLYTGNTERIYYQVISEGNSNYVTAFESSDTEVATVDEYGYVTGVEMGTAQITLTVTDLCDKTDPKVYKAVANVTCEGVLKPNDIELETTEIEMYEHSGGVQIIAHVLPMNATYQTLYYNSSNEKVVTVTETGLVLPVGPGNATVRVKYDEHSNGKTVNCTVLPLSFADAANAYGGDLDIQNNAVYPFVPTVDSDGMPCIMSSNQKKDGTTSEITIDAGSMKKGDTFSFDWRASCEEKYDTLSFYVNDEKTDTVSGLTDWARYTYTADRTGNCIFRIEYSKDMQTYTNDDAGYVRNIELHKIGEKHTVTFYDMDSTTIIARKQVDHADAALPPDAPEHEGYVFLRWSRNTDRVLSDLDIYAVYTPLDAPSHIIVGDVNDDKQINTADAVVVLKSAAGMLSLSTSQNTSADVNSDGSVNTADAVLILKFAAGMITSF